MYFQNSFRNYQEINVMEKWSLLCYFIWSGHYCIGVYTMVVLILSILLMVKLGRRRRKRVLFHCKFDNFDIRLKVVFFNAYISRADLESKNWCMGRFLSFLIRYFSHYYTLHRSDLAVRAAPLDPRLYIDTYNQPETPQCCNLQFPCYDMFWQ